MEESYNNSTDHLTSVKRIRLRLIPWYRSGLLKWILGWQIKERLSRASSGLFSSSVYLCSCRNVEQIAEV